MQVQHIGYRIRGFYRVAALGYLWDMTPKDAQRRFEILCFFDKHGLGATRDAFGVSRRTLYPHTPQGVSTRCPFSRGRAVAAGFRYDCAIRAAASHR